MNKKLFKKIFPLIAILLLAPWPVAYAYASDNGSNTPETSLITAAPIESAPKVSVFGGAISGVTSGDLFYIDALDRSADMPFTLYITNAEELIHDYRYIILQVGVYVQDNTGQWVKASGADGQTIQVLYITMLNGHVSFSLPGLAKYKVTIDGGSVYSLMVGSRQEGIIQPQFYMEIQ